MSEFIDSPLLVFLSIIIAGIGLGLTILCCIMDGVQKGLSLLKCIWDEVAKTNEVMLHEQQRQLPVFGASMFNNSKKFNLEQRIKNLKQGDVVTLTNGVTGTVTYVSSKEYRTPFHMHTKEGLSVTFAEEHISDVC